LKTRELYVVSLVHALEDVFLYKIIGNHALGIMSQKAIYLINIQNEIMYQMIILISYFLGTLFMLLLCKKANRFFKNGKKISINKN